MVSSVFRSVRCKALASARLVPDAG